MNPTQMILNSKNNPNPPTWILFQNWIQEYKFGGLDLDFQIQEEI